MKQEKRSRKDNIKSAGIISGSGYVGYKGYRSGIPRVLGVRLERHTTSKKNLGSIFSDKSRRGWLDPKYGGGTNGASKSSFATTHGLDESFTKASKGYVHITGVHPKSPFASRVKGPLRTLYRKQQGLMYTGVINVSEGKKKTTIPNLLAGGIFGTRAKTLYTPGSDNYFEREFISDTDDVALKSTKKVPVYKNRLDAVIGEMKHRKKNNIKVKDFHRRGAGAGLVALGTVAGAVGVNEVVKAFNRNGRAVKGYTRKRKKSRKNK